MKIPKETKKLIWKLYKGGTLVKNIPALADVTYSTARLYSTLKEKGFSSYGKYMEHLAHEK